MNPVNYGAMSDGELKQYFLKHREDKLALRAYLDRLADRPRHVITTVDDPEFEQKLQASVMQQIQATEGNAERD
ncbi:DUF6887 family protein [Oscillatoria acuminata]|uniref:Uncharacterized protein n=1 Tax=Oscillatoria acuminata PCC 6304 TaxID=56110 RepID=K9THR4_9CYAN|nr:hypothetical protein [Oscillatoria acuminata]AFY82085.1 hypothetical protein Oscil6304_2466 [Oscillatoria acuminata PCC 6304]